MATIKFILQSKSELSNIYVRYVISSKIDLKRKTGYTIHPDKWSKTKKEPIKKDDGEKGLSFKLDRLKLHLTKSYNNAVSEGVDFTGDWLQTQIDVFHNKKVLIELDVLANSIDKYILDAPYKVNQKKGTGLSEGRIRNLKLFKNTILRFESEIFKGKSILIKNVNLSFTEEFKKWLFSKGYSINYVGKNITNLKTICNDAYKNGIETSSQLKNIKTISQSKTPEEIIYLSEEEQEKIKNAVLKRESLINARKWLLIGCLIGQRGGDFLSITKKNIREKNGMKIIELKQQKTGKLVAIPLLPNALEILKNGFPYKISLTKFNEYIKEVCKIAEINEIITGSIKETCRGPEIKKTLPKYNFISSHVCRRSFSSNFYGRIPTPVLMNITGHGTEQVFLAYIGKTTYDNAYQMYEYFKKLMQKEGITKK